jgi:DNA-binding GntR family transcriptional regulator
MSEPSGDAVYRAAEAIRKLIQSGEYLPGQSLGQASLAEQVGLSRAPVREALQLLLAQGLVRHMPNSGYTVARLSASELRQIYTMRKHLETEVLSSIDLENVTEGALVELRGLHQRMDELKSSPDVFEFQRLNRGFHFGQFKLAHLDAITAEIDRLWQLSEQYRLLWVSMADNRDMVVKEHGLLLEALEQGDLPRLCTLMDAHRQTTRVIVGGILQGS